MSDSNEINEKSVVISQILGIWFITLNYSRQGLLSKGLHGIRKLD